MDESDHNEFAWMGGCKLLIPTDGWSLCRLSDSGFLTKQVARDGQRGH